MKGTTMITQTEIVLTDPCTSHWLREALRSSLRRDPIDAVSDAEILVEILRNRQREHQARVRRAWQIIDGHA